MTVSYARRRYMSDIPDAVPATHAAYRPSRRRHGRLPAAPPRPYARRELPASLVHCT